MKKSVELGMKTFDQCLYELYDAGDISLQELQVNSDAKSELMLRLKLNSKRFIKEELSGGGGGDTGGLSLQVEKAPEVEESTGPLVVNIKKPEPARPAATPAPATPTPAAPAASPKPLELLLDDDPPPPRT